jgi:8-oxo-dGTP pyrophosphatase MutT (NUDIX family)
MRSLPPKLLETARAFAAGERIPAAPRDAATVLLLRDGAAGPEVHVMRRRTSMAFAGGMVAFPGGGVSESDAATELPDASAWAARLGVEPEVARAVVGAAVRELEEETGVVVPASDLGLWDAWTTPEFEPRRYRTWFFAAELPAGQEAAELSTESSSVEWVTAAEALDRADAGEWTLLPPTYCACLRLSAFASVADAMAAAHETTVEMFTPTLSGETLSMPAWARPLWEARG